MSAKDVLIQEIEQAPEFLLEEVLDFLRFLKIKHLQEKLEVSVLSESSLQKGLLRSEEAW